jgi:hypothetical protein
MQRLPSWPDRRDDRGIPTTTKGGIVADHIYEDGRHVGYIKDGFALDPQDRKRYRVELDKLIDLKTGQIIGYLNVLGTVSKKGLFD